MIPYNVIFTGRRTFCICLRPNGVVEARAPKGMSLRQVQELVEQYCPFEHVYLQKASAAIASNSGPRAFGLLFMRK